MDFTKDRLTVSEQVEEGLERITLGFPGGQISAFEALQGMQDAIDALKAKLTAQMTQDASMVAAMSSAKDALAMCRKEIADTHTFYQGCAVEIAANLAFAGNHPHKEKNEAIMNAITRLLAFTTNRNRAGDMDKIPF